MLVLTRRTGEVTYVGDDVKIPVLGICGNQVRIGIDAPKSIPVHREEIWRRIHKERADVDGNRVAAVSDPEVPAVAVPRAVLERG